MSFRNPYLRIIAFILVVLFVGNLGAIIDKILHPEIEYLDEEHLIVGGMTMLVIALLFGALALYARSQEKTVKKYRESEETLKESEEKYRDLFEESHDVVFISTPEGRFQDINRAGLELFGYRTLAEIKQIDIARDLYVDPAQRELMRLKLEQEGHVKDFELEMKRKDGGRILVTMTASVIMGKDGRAEAYRGILHDVSEERELHRQLVESQKMESVGRLAGGIAHDFNNLLTTISGYAELALADEPPDSIVNDYLEEIREAAIQATELAAQLLLFSQTQPAETRPFDLNRLVMDCLGKIDQEAGPHVSVSTDLYNGATVVDASHENIEHALLNLVKNARAAMPDGGHILVRTDQVSIDEEYSKRQAGAYPGDFCELSVTDTGIGMDKETMSHVFEPFFTTRGGKDGNGLGLAVVYGVVSQHDGWIEVSSEPGDGATFRLFFPLSRDSAPVESMPVLEESLKGNGERILLVEDDEGVRRLTERMLGNNGYNVFGVGNAEEAFDMFAREKGDFQLIFSDVALPGENGIKLVEHLHTYKPGLPVLLVSGYSEVFADWRFVQDKGYRFLQKPYMLPKLLQTISDLLGSNN